MSVFIGIETPDQKLLKTTQKMQNIPGDLLNKLRKIRSHGIHVLAGFILGFDGEDQHVFELQRSFLQASGIGIAMIGLLQAIPHTQLSRRLKKEGRLLEKIPVKVIPTLEGINFIPKGEVTKREYLQQYALLAQELYQPKAYFERILRGLLDLRQKVRLPRGIYKKHLGSALNDIFYVAFKMKGTRLYFWRSLFELLWKNPSALPAFFNECCWFPYLKKHADDNVQREITKYLSNPPSEDILDKVIPSPVFA